MYKVCCELYCSVLIFICFFCFGFNLLRLVFISEDEHIPPVLTKDQPKSKWDDEDVDENDVKESWEDDEELALVIYLYLVII